MPKSRTRKHRKQKRRPIPPWQSHGKQSSQAPATGGEQGVATVVSRNGFAAKGIHGYGIVSAADHLDLVQGPLYRFLELSPLPIGLIIASGLQSTNFRPHFFIVVALLLVAVRWAELLYRRRHATKGAILLLIVLAVSLVLIGAAFAISGSVLVGLLVSLVGAMFYCTGRLRVDSLRSLTAYLVVLVTEMSLLLLLGIYSQSGEFQPAALPFGFIPGAVLGAVAVVMFAEIVERRGSYRRVIERERNDGKIVRRPGVLPIIFSGLTMLVPGVFVLVTPVGIVPFHFLLLILPLMLTPGIATAFLEQKIPDNLVARKALQLAAGVAVTTFVIGLMLSRGL